METGLSVNRRWVVHEEMALPEVWGLDPVPPPDRVVLNRKTFVLQFVAATLRVCQCVCIIKMYFIDSQPHKFNALRS